MEAKEYFEQGYDKQITQNYKEAIKDYDKVIELDSDDMAEAYYTRGIIRYANLLEYELAIEDFTKAIEMDYCSVFCYLRIADCYRNLDKLDKALLNYYKVLSLKPQSCYKAAALGNIGFIKHLHGLFDEAMKYYKKSKKPTLNLKLLMNISRNANSH